MHRWVNLSLLVLFPLSWFAPLMRAGLLPLFGLNEISILTGLVSLLESSFFLAMIVAIFALIAPIVKTVALAMIHFDRLSPRFAPHLGVLGKLAMADVFLIALYIVVAKGVPIGSIETAWGLYLFTACILASLWVSWRTEQLAKSAKTGAQTETKNSQI